MGRPNRLRDVPASSGPNPSLLLADTFAGLDSAERRQCRFTAADRLEQEGMVTYAQEELTKMITPAKAERMTEVSAHVMEMMVTTPGRGAAAALRACTTRGLSARAQTDSSLLSSIRCQTTTNYIR